MSEDKRFRSLISECRKAQDDVFTSVKKFLGTLNEFKDRDGISLLEVKNRELLAYMMDITYLMSLMSYGESIQNNSALERLIYLRTVMERIRPLERRLKTQMEKMLSTGTTVNNSEKAVRPRPDNFESDEASERSGDEDNEHETLHAMKKYVPPKVMAVRYDEDENEKEDRLKEKSRRRALQSSLIQDLRAQYSEAPEELCDETIDRRKKQSEIEKTGYEEDYLVRLQMSKRERHKKKKEDRQNILNDLLRFGDYMAASDTKHSMDDGPSNKKPRHSQKFRGGLRFEKMRTGGKRTKESSSSNKKRVSKKKKR
ncbi:hypothetical protein AB6A40_004334 [Gnathostoma spinigerum]|uniref:Neuroguidin n=1 Tax=Gnathostoma spinigerum TaxID=75299 RepID=A0ABD6EMW3_9BILA